MYKVIFLLPTILKECGEKVRPTIAQFKTDVEAVQFALSLHQVSNVPHTIRVENPDGEFICHFFVPEVTNG